MTLTDTTAPAPSAGAVPRERRRGIVIVPESDVARLAQLEPGQQIIGMSFDPMRAAFLVVLSGPGLPLVDEMCDPPTVSGFRYAAPPFGRINLEDVAGMTPLQVHALVLLALDPQDQGHAPGTPWAVIVDTLRRHAPVELNGRTWCAQCCRGCQGRAEGQHWPCVDYAAAAATAGDGLEAGDLHA